MNIHPDPGLSPPPRAPGYGSYGYPEQTQRWDLNGLLGIFRRRWYVIVGVIALALLGALAVGKFSARIYDAQVRLKLDSSQDADAARPMSLFRGDDMAIETEIALIRSRSVADAVARNLNLPEVAASASGDVPERVIGWLLQNLKVDREPSTYITDVGFRSRDPRFAARAANAFAEEYLNISVSRRTGVAGRQARVLDERVKALSQEVQDSEGRVARYRAGAGIVENSGQATITDQQVAPLTGQLASAEATAAALRANLAAARAQIARGGLETVSAVLNSGVVADLRRQRADLLREQAQIQGRYGDRHPESQRVAEQLAGVDRQIAEQGRRIVAGIESDSRAADASAASLRGQLGQLRGAQANDNRAAVMADSMQRDADAKRQMYNQLALSAQQANQEERSFEPKAMIIERAVPPLKPSWPKPALLAIVGLVVGALGGVALAFLLDVLASGFQTVGELESQLGVPFLASLPLLSKRRRTVADGRELTMPEFVIEKPMSGYAEALRTVRGLLTLDRPAGGIVLAISSAVPNEGKTSTSASLARIMAMSGDRVIVLDCDLRQAGLSRIFPGHEGQGLFDVLEGRARPEEAIVTDERTGLDLLPLSGPSFTPRDVFAGETFRALLQDLRDHYDYVLLDTPPLLAVAEARTLAALSDAVLMVVRWNSTPRRAVKAAVAKLRQQDGIAILGAVMSMAKASAGDSADPAYYSKLYRQYQEA